MTVERTTRRGERGLTLIEILLALIIMVLGIVGILALFPPALQSGKEAMEVTQAGITAQSVANSVATGVRFASYNAATGDWTVTLTHDLNNSGTTSIYTFNLPKLTDNWKHHPGNGTPSTNPEADPEFKLVGDGWIQAEVDNVRTKSDPTEPLKQFAFSFACKKINTLAYLIGTPKPGGGNYTLADLEGIVKLFEFRVHIFRLASNASGGGGTGTGGGTTNSKKLVATVTTRVSTK
jgi:Tfp pilus assembly protein PilV